MRFVGPINSIRDPLKKTEMHFLKKKKKAKTQNVDADVVSKQILGLSSSVEFSR